jgi:chemotaxis protein CheX
MSHMKADILNAFLGAALTILETETKGPVDRTGLFLDGSDQVSDQVTVFVALVGGIRGMIMVGMPTTVAREVAGKMMGETLAELTEMSMSALAELGNLIAGLATISLEQQGYIYDITPPTLMIGRRSRISTLGLPRFVIPLQTQEGLVNLHIAIDL